MWNIDFFLQHVGFAMGTLAEANASASVTLPYFRGVVMCIVLGCVLWCSSPSPRALDTARSMDDRAKETLLNEALDLALDR